MTSVLVCHNGDGVMLQGLRACLPGQNIRFRSGTPEGDESTEPFDLVVRLCLEIPDNQDEAFFRWLSAARVPALDVQLEASEILIGPLSLPGRVGCGYCSRARRVAAEAQLDANREVASRIELSAFARLLETELTALIEAGASQSHLLDHVVIHNVAKNERSTHRVIPLPWCPFCGGACKISTVLTPFILRSDDPPENLVLALGGWVDARTGVISRLQLEGPSPGREVPVIATAFPPHILIKNRGVDGGQLRRLPLGWGKGLNLSSALLSAIGEAIERYSASLPDPERIAWVRCEDLGEGFLDPRDFAVYSDEQYERAGFRYARFDPNIVHPWVRGTWAHSGKPVWVPAILAFLYLPVDPRQLFSQGTSNGLAAATDARDAALRALLELVERDAFMTAWLTGCSGRRIELDDTLDPQLQQVLDGLEALGAKVEVYALSTSAYGTVIICLALGDGSTCPAVTIGLAADLDPISALRQAVLELAQTGPHLRQLMLVDRTPVPKSPEAVSGMLDHAIYYFPVERINAFDRLRDSDGTIGLRELREDCPSDLSLDALVTGLKAADIRVAFVDVTSPDVATSSFRVVRAVSPDLQPLSYGFGLDFPPVPRVRKRGLAPLIPPIHPIS